MRKASGWAKLEDSFGHCFGWTAADSQSGFNAPRAHLARYVTPKRASLFSEIRGPLGAPTAALDALRRAEVDVIALDSFWLDLCRRHEPSKLEGVSCLAATAWTPNPLLVAAEQVPARVVERLRSALVQLHESPAYSALLADVLVERFVMPDVESYARLEEMATRVWCGE